MTINNSIINLNVSGICICIFFSTRVFEKYFNTFYWTELGRQVVGHMNLFSISVCFFEYYYSHDHHCLHIRMGLSITYIELNSKHLYTFKMPFFFYITKHTLSKYDRNENDIVSFFVVHISIPNTTQIICEGFTCEIDLCL